MSAERIDAEPAPESRFLVDSGGSLGALIGAHDWSATLGDPSGWPRGLQAIVRMMVTSRYQMWMGWGPELIFLCNDAYRPTLGVKYPWAIGQPTRVVWAEIWDEIGPLIDQVLRTGEATYSEAMLLLLERSGFREETYHTFSYSPLFDDDGSIGGMFCVVVEETERVINDRRLETLRRLSAAAAASRTEAELCAANSVALAANPADLPFTLLYMFDADRAGATLVAGSGFAAGHPAAPASLRDGAGPWPYATLLADPAMLVLDDLAQWPWEMPRGAWDAPPVRALLMPIGPQGGGQQGGGQDSGFLVVGLNPYRSFGTAYQGFVNLLAGQIAAALAAARTYEAERRRAEALAELDRAKTAFFSNVSHEFRTPLTLMLGPLQDALAQTEGAVRRQLDLAHRNGVRLLRLVNNLLDFSRIEAGRAQARFVPTDFARFSAEIAASFRSTVERAGLRFTIEAGALGRPVYLDREMWEKILFNLLSNAFKFTLQGGITVTVGLADGDYAEVRVRDTGIGVSAAELPRLFERFHRVEGADGRSIEGSGIGLALVQELVKLHGGTIAADSREGEGTCFTIRLAFGTAHLPAEQVMAGDAPIQLGSAAMFIEEALRWLPRQAGEAAPEAVLRDPAAAGRRIILADDNADMLDYLCRLLEGQGYAVECVGDGLAALDAARAAPPDLILTDVMMPLLDGFGLLRAVRGDAALAGTPVVLLSARAGEEAKIEGLAAGADDYLTKPFAARELLARVSTNIQMALVRREAAREVMRSEQRLLLTRERLDLALSTGRIAIYELDTASGTTMMFGPLVSLFGVSAEAAAQGLPRDAFLAAIDPADFPAVNAAVQAALADAAPFDMGYRVLGGAEPRYVTSRATLQIDASGGRRLVGAIIDVSEEKRAQDALRAQTTALASLNATLEERIATAVTQRLEVEEALRQAQKMEAVGQLTGGVAHDFNNLLTVIIGGLDTIRRRGPTEDSRVSRALELATQGAQRAATLTARLLAFSRRQPLAPKPLDLNHVVRDSTELLHRTLGETVELETVLGARLWPIEADQNQLENAIINLAVNARDAMPGGGRLTIETANTMLDESYVAKDSEVIPGQYALVAISDTGAGMSPETLGRVFEPFYTTKEVGKGTGLGLSMVYGFVKQSGGHVTIYSEPGQGTTVRLYFPRFRGSLPEDSVVETIATPTGVKDEIILVVEDNDAVRTYSVMMLHELGYTVLEAADADAALVILRGAGRIDLLFTDVVLPGRTGRELAGEAVALRPELRVLFTTGYSRNAIIHHGRLDAGVQLLTKPFTYEQLAVRIRDVLDRGR